MEQLGLATRSEYALGLRDIYITLSLDPNSIHTLSAILSTTALKL